LKKEMGGQRRLFPQHNTERYHYPIAIAFAPEHGENTKDPLYFIAELRGKVKVVTADRIVSSPFLEQVGCRAF
jgi:hypothetical protein